MTEAVSQGGQNATLPLFISTSVRRIQRSGEAGNDSRLLLTDCLSCLAPTIDRMTGKCGGILDHLILSAIKSKLVEDIFVLGEAGDIGEIFQTHINSLKSRRKRLFAKTRLRYVEIPSSSNCRSETDELKYAIEQDIGGALIANGFIWTHALVIPPNNWSKFITTSKTMTKKDSLAVAVFYPEMCMTINDGNAVGSRHQLIVLNQKNGELLKRTRLNVYRRKSIDIKQDLALEGKFSSPPEDIEIRTDIQSFPMFYGNGMTFLKFVQSNFDYSCLEDMMDDGLKAENALESFYVFRDPDQLTEPDWTARPGTSLRYFRVLYNYLKEDSCRYTDQMALKGERSYWKYDVEKSNVYHESCMIKDKNIQRSLIFENVKIANNPSISDCVLCNGSSVDRDIRGIVVCSNNSTLDQGTLSFGYVLRGEGFVRCDDETEFKFDVLCSFNDQERQAELNEYKNNTDERQLRKTDDVLDKLYSDGSSVAHSDEEKDEQEDSVEFGSEVASMISSVIDNPEHMANIIMELRTYRLAEFKSDHDVLKAAMPVLLAHLDLTKYRGIPDLQNRVTTSKMGDLVQSFCCNIADDSSTAREGHAILYNEIAKFANDNTDTFPKLCAAFNEYCDHATHLPIWVESNADTYPQLLKNASVLNQYLEWLADGSDADDDDDESESD